MADFAIRTARQRRKQVQKKSADMGIDETYISTLVETFYARIRNHQELGPIFERVIGNQWDTHLQRMKDFWASVTLNAGLYSGKPVPAHQKLEGVTRDHFKTWLALFRSTLKDTAPTTEAVMHFMERAERIAESLQLAMFGYRELPETDGTPKRVASVISAGEKP